MREVECDLAIVYHATFGDDIMTVADYFPRFAELGVCHNFA